MKYVFSDHKAKAADYTEYSRDAYNRGHDYMASVYGRIAAEEKRLTAMKEKQRKQYERGW